MPRTSRHAVAGVCVAVAVASVVTAVDAGGVLQGSKAAAAVVQPLGGGRAPTDHPAADATGKQAVAPRRAIDPALEARLQDRLSRATAGHVGMVVDIAGVGRVATINAGAAVRPASTQKLFTTLPLLLDQPDRRLRTTVTATVKPQAGVLHGNLVVHSAGDPSLLKHHLNVLGQQVRAAGIRTVTGDLVLDVGHLPSRTRQAGWKPDFVPDDIGPLSPFPVYEDVWRKDARYVAHPTRANFAMLRQRFADVGVRVAGDSQITRSAADGVVVAEHQSRPISELVRHTLRVSDNFYAETLLPLAGGHARVDAVSAAAGVADKSYATDGSGLSYDDRESPRGEVQLLDYARTSSAYRMLHAALPVACRSGTLKHRMCDTVGAGAVYAKTGTLTHSSALAGYTTDAAGRAVTFSVITAGVRSLTAAMKAIDRAVLVIRRYAG